MKELENYQKTSNIWMLIGQTLITKVGFNFTLTDIFEVVNQINKKYNLTISNQKALEHLDQWCESEWITYKYVPELTDYYYVFSECAKNYYFPIRVMNEWDKLIFILRFLNKNLNGQKFTMNDVQGLVDILNEHAKLDITPEYIKNYINYLCEIGIMAYNELDDTLCIIYFPQDDQELSL